MTSIFVTPDVFQSPMSLLNDKASWNMPRMFVTWDVFQKPISWLNEEAPANINSMLTEREVSKALMVWSNDFAEWNMKLNSVTWDVIQFPMSWLKESAPENILDRSVTRETSQPLMFWLNAVQFPNMVDISVTCEVSHLEISPLNIPFWLNRLFTWESLDIYPPMFVTRVVFQYGIVPYFEARPYIRHSPNTGLSDRQFWIASLKVKSERRDCSQVLLGPESGSSQVYLSWKDVALRNMFCVFVALEASQLEISILNIEAPSNIDVMSLELDMSHSLISWLNFAAEKNMCLKFVTCDVSHFEIFPLKVLFNANPAYFPLTNPAISVTRPVFHSIIIP